MKMAAVAGLRGTGDWGTDERPKNFREMILWRNPNGKAPLTALTSKMRSQSVDDPEFSWWEEELNPIRLQVNGTISTTTYTTVIVDSGDATNLVAGDVLLVEKAESESSDVYSYDNEIVVVASVSATTQFIVARAQAGTTAAAIPDDAFLTKIGNVYEEGSTSPDSSTRNPTKKTNYCQIFKTSYRITETAKRTRTRTGDPLKNDKKRKMFDHSVALEYSFLFGKPYEDTSGTKPKRYTGGLLHYLAEEDANAPNHCVKVWTTTPTVDTFFDSVYRVWDYDGGTAGSERLVFAGNGFLNRLNKIARGDSGSRINFDGVVRQYGMELMRFILPQGTLYIRSHPLMNVHSKFNKGAFVIDPTSLVYRHLRDTTPQDNIQAPDADEQKGQWLSECGLEFHHAKTMQYHANFDN
jgi:hypothetical protein